jgi:hypothetical protein
MHPNMTLRLAVAGVLGIFGDLFAMGDAYSYSSRLQQSHATALGCAVAALLVVPAILNFSIRRTFAVTAVVWMSMAVTHTVVLIAETSRDPTSHNLLPFEYVFICFLTLPAVIGAAAGRLAGATWAARARNKAESLTDGSGGRRSHRSQN